MNKSEYRLLMISTVMCGVLLGGAAFTLTTLSLAAYMGQEIKGVMIALFFTGVVIPLCVARFAYKIGSNLAKKYFHPLGQD